MEGANTLLLELLRFKIRFHDQKLFQDYAAHSQDQSNSKDRIAALSLALEEVRGLMARAKLEGGTIELDCQIHIVAKTARRNLD